MMDTNRKLPELTPDLKAKLIFKCNDLRYANTIAEYINLGDLSYEDFPNLEESSRQRIDQKLENFRQKEESEKLRKEAEKKREEEEKARKAREEEDAEWARKKEEANNRYDEIYADPELKGDKNVVLEFLEKYPESEHFDDLEKQAFEIVSGIKPGKCGQEHRSLSEFIADLEDFFSRMENIEKKGKAVRFKDKVLALKKKAEDIKAVRDKLFYYDDYFGVLDDNPEHEAKNSETKATFFAKVANYNTNNDADLQGCLRKYIVETFEDLKEKERKLMLLDPSQYPLDDFKKLLAYKIFTKNEVCCLGVITPKILRELEHPTPLPHIDQKESEENLQCLTTPRHTDVYLFGIPSTGKTCVLTGLLGAKGVIVQNQLAGGDYGDALKKYRKAGVALDRTTGVTVINAEIYREDEKNSHRVNFIEMPGEEFAVDIAQHPDASPILDHMGNGAAKLLGNDNDKIFFLVIDPTAQTVEIERQRKDTDGTIITDSEGKAIYDEYNIDQETSLDRIINLFKLPENRKVLNRVKAIHFIVTKADMLTEENSFQDLEHTYAKVKDNLEKMIENFKSESSYHREINYLDNGKVNYYLFSLGKFYVGKRYEYDQKYADDLIDVIIENSASAKKRTFFNKIQDILNPKD